MWPNDRGMPTGRSRAVGRCGRPLSVAYLSEWCSEPTQGSAAGPWPIRPTAYNRAVVVSTQYETVIGIEVHAQLRTDSKMFCSCPTAPAEGAADEPNTRVCPICLGMPGT